MSHQSIAEVGQGLCSSSCLGTRAKQTPGHLLSSPPLLRCRPPPNLGSLEAGGVAQRVQHGALQYGGRQHDAQGLGDL